MQRGVCIFNGVTITTLVITRMSKVVSERWKRRVGQFHWALDEDEFVRYSPPLHDDTAPTRFHDNTLVMEAPLLPPKSAHISWMSFCAWGILLVVVSVLIFVIMWRRQHKISIFASSWWNRRRNRRASKREAKHVHEAKSIQWEKGRHEVISATKRIHDENEISARVDNNKGDTETSQQTLLSEQRDELLLEQSRHDREWMESTSAPPILVDEIANTNEPATAVPVSNSLQLVPCMHDCSISSINLTTAAATQYLDLNDIVVTAAQDATNVAQSIRVTQAVFEQHGLDSSIATEWAMRRQESELSVCVCVLIHYFHVFSRVLSLIWQWLSLILLLSFINRRHVDNDTLIVDCTWMQFKDMRIAKCRNDSFEK